MFTRKPLCFLWFGLSATLSTINGTGTPTETFSPPPEKSPMVSPATVPPFPLSYDFADGSLQGWTDASFDGDRNQLFAIVPPSIHSPNTTPHSGGHFIGLQIPAFGGQPFYTQDSPHDTLWMQSPEFTLQGAGELTVWLSGGGPGSPSLAGTLVDDLSATTTLNGFRGVALRDVGAGLFVLSGTKSATGNQWEQVTFTEAEIDALDRDATYTLDLIDAGHGGWGWVNLDSVAITSNIPFEPVGDGVVINEFSGNNNTVIADEDGDYEDWIELFNASGSPLALEGYGLSDDPERPFRWMFPSVVLEPGKYLLIWTSGKNRAPTTGELHANFSISREGEPLQLVDRTGMIVDAVEAVSFPSDISYGRLPDGLDNWAYFARPSPGATNNQSTGYAGFLQPPDFSHPSGYYEAPFSLTLTAADSEADIFYSLDGSDPAAANLDGASYDYKNQYPDGPLLQRSRLSLEYVSPLAISQSQLPLESITTINTESSSQPFNATAWRTDGDETVQTSLTQDVRFMFGDTAWTDYELTLQAQKTGGDQGFLIFFRADGDHYYLLNIGRDNNTRHAIEKGDGHGGHSIHAGLQMNGSVQTGQWYSIRIRLEGTRFQVWLDEQLLFDPIDWPANLNGQIGIGTSRTAARFRNIHVTPLDNLEGTPLFTGLPTRKSDLTVIRARASKEGYLPSETVTRSFFTGAAFQNRPPLPIIAIATDEANFFDYVRGIYVPGRNYDQMGHPNFFGRGVAWERPAHITFFEPDGQVGFCQNAGVRIHGGVTRIFPQKSLRLYARGGQYGESRFSHPVHPDLPYTSFNRLLLRHSGNDHNQTMFRDAMLQRLVEHLSFDTQAYRPAMVYLNGEYWGLHNIRDRYDRHYLARVHGVDPGNLDILTFSPAATHSVKEGFDTHYAETLAFIETHGLSNPEHFDYIKTRIDVGNFLDYNVSQIIINNSDWPGNNHDFWRNRVDEYDPIAPLGHDGRWRWMMFDTDFGFGLGSNASFNLLAALMAPPEEVGNDWWRQPHATFLLQNFLENESFRTDFINRFADLLNTAFQPERVIGVIDDMQAAIDPVMDAHIERWRRPGSRPTWLNNVNVMRNFAHQRPDHMRSHLRSQFGLTDHALTVDVSVPDAGHVRVNTIDVESSTPGIHPSPYPWSGTYFNLPIQVTAVPAPGYRFSHWQELAGSPDAEWQTLSLSLSEDRSLTAVFEESPLSSLLHYWHFNDLPEGPVFDEVEADHNFPGAAAITYTGTGVGYMDDTDGSELNLRLAVEVGKGLRVRNPSHDRALEFTLPTTGYENVRFTYAVMRTTNGAEGQQVEYQTDPDGPWMQAGGPLTISTEYQLFTFDFSAIPGANDNPDFQIRIRFGGTNAPGESGNNRFDNITLDGSPLPGTVPPPELLEPIQLQKSAEQISLTLDLDDYFASPDGGPLTYEARADKVGLADLQINGSNLILTALYRGEATITVSAHDGSNPPITTTFGLLIYPRPHPLADGPFTFHTWASSQPENTFPEHLLFLQSNLTDPELETELEHAYFIPEEDYHESDSIGFPYNNTRRTRLNGLGPEGISFINTGRDRDLGGALLALDTTAQDHVQISWTGGTVEPNSRVYHLRLQYRTAIDQPFIDLLDEQSNPVEYVRNSTAGHSEKLGPMALPVAALNQPNLHLLWRYYYTGHRLDAISGTRDELSLGDIVITTDPPTEAPTTYEEWRAANSTGADDLLDPNADPKGDGITNLMRYAFGIPLNASGRERLPRIVPEADAFYLLFPYRAEATDLAYLIESSDDLASWNAPLLDTRSGPVEPDSNGNLRINVSPDPQSERYFFRVRILYEGS